MRTLYNRVECRLISGVSLRHGAIISIQAIITTFVVIRAVSWWRALLLCDVAFAFVQDRITTTAKLTTFAK